MDTPTELANSLALPSFKYLLRAFAVQQQVNNHTTEGKIVQPGSNFLEELTNSLVQGRTLLCIQREWIHNDSSKLRRSPLTPSFGVVSSTITKP